MFDSNAAFKRTHLKIMTFAPKIIYSEVMRLSSIKSIPLGFNWNLCAIHCFISLLSLHIHNKNLLIMHVPLLLSWVLQFPNVILQFCFQSVYTYRRKPITKFPLAPLFIGPKINCRSNKSEYLITMWIHLIFTLDSYTVSYNFLPAMHNVIASRRKISRQIRSVCLGVAGLKICVSWKIWIFSVTATVLM